MSDEAVAAPWQNRPSILSTWEHSVSGFDESGFFIIDLGGLLVQNNLLVDPFLGNPLCIPRACRMTRACINLRYEFFEEPTEDTFVLFDLWRSQECEDFGYENVFSTAIDVLAKDFFLLNCACFDVGGILFNECDQWYPSLITSANIGISFPSLRITFHFELR